MRKSSKSRFVNGVIAALITVFFVVHGLMGGLSLSAGIPSSLSWLAWGGVVLAGCHVVASIVTSKEQLSDVERPPSARKKRHLALKWATGGVLAVLAIVHMVIPKGSLIATVALVALSAALAVHVWVGSKSLLKDVGIDRRYQTPLRVVICAFAVVAVCMVLMGAVR